MANKKPLNISIESIDFERIITKAFTNVIKELNSKNAIGDEIITKKLIDKTIPKIVISLKEAKNKYNIKLKTLFIEYKEIGMCEINIPYLVKRWKSIYFITYFKDSGYYVVNLNKIAKCNISVEQGKELIKELNLKKQYITPNISKYK